MLLFCHRKQKYTSIGNSLEINDCSECIGNDSEIKGLGVRILAKLGRTICRTVVSRPASRRKKWQKGRKAGESVVVALSNNKREMGRVSRTPFLAFARSKTEINVCSRPLLLAPSTDFWWPCVANRRRAETRGRKRRRSVLAFGLCSGRSNSAGH